MIRLALFALFLFVNSLAFAQQWVQFTQANAYGSFLNPGHIGYQSNLNATAAHRSQYVGLGTRAIGTQFVSFSSPFLSSKFGLGFRLVNDFIGVQRFTHIDLGGAYHIMQGKHRLSAGFQLGIVQLSINGAELTAPDGNYLSGVVVHNDQVLPQESSSGSAPTISAGLIYGYKKFEVGVSMQHVSSPQIELSNTANGTLIILSRTINLYSSYVIEANNVKVKPTFFSKTDFKEWQAQMNLEIDWRKLIVGAGYRGYSGLNNDAIIGMFGFRVKEKIRLVYSYDYNVSFLNNSNSGSHELSLRFDLPKSFKQTVKSNKIFNPRYL